MVQNGARPGSAPAATDDAKPKGAHAGDKGYGKGKRQQKPKGQPGHGITELKAGQKVYVFHRYSQDPNGYFMVNHAISGLVHPSIGRTDGWTEAEVTEDWYDHGYDYNAYPTWVQIKWSHQKWFNRRGFKLDVTKASMVTQRVMPEQIRLKESPGDAIEPPILSMFHVRWGGEYPVDPVTEGVGGWGQIGSTPSDNFINGFDDHVFASIGPRYETHSAFVQSSAELGKICPALIREMLRSENIAGFYFLWPIAFQDGHEYSGYVTREDLFQLMSGMECAGIPTRFTHPSHLYKIYASKEWVSQQCLNQYFRCPLTTLVPRQLIAQDPERAAYQAHHALQNLARARGKWNPEAGCNPTVPKGVVKLGWSWEARDVMSWTTHDELQHGLGYLGEQAGSHMEHVLCQEWVDFDIEMRCYIVEPSLNDPRSMKPEKIVYTTFGHSGNAFRSFDRMEKDGALAAKFNNDVKAMEDAERQACDLIETWLQWFQAACCEMPIFTRFDILAKHVGPGKAVVWTGELTELGGCFLGWQDGPKCVFRAILRSCFGRHPRWIPEKNEWDDHPAMRYGLKQNCERKLFR